MRQYLRRTKNWWYNNYQGSSPSPINFQQ